MTTSKKQLTALALAAAIFTMSSPAQADGGMEKLNPYFGIDLQRMHIDYKSVASPLLDDKLNGMNVHVGIRPHRNFGAELGYFRQAEASKTVPVIGQTTLRLHGVTLDALGYLPLGKNGRFEAIGTVGVAYSHAKLSNIVVGSDSDTELGWRLGGGAQYHFTDSVSGRALLRYQDADFDGVANHALTGSVGVNYRF